MPAEYFHVDLDVSPLLQGKKDCQTKEHKEQVDSWLDYFGGYVSTFGSGLYGIIGLPIMFLVNGSVSIYNMIFGERKRHEMAYDEA